MKPPSPSSNRFRQVYASPKRNSYTIIQSSGRDKDSYLDIANTQHHAALRSALQTLCPEKLWYGAADATCCPRPILITRQHVMQVEELHGALVVAITDIVERWFTDTEARFPERMRLEDKEEELLRWIEAQSPDVLPPFTQHLGSWRPDFLVEEGPAGQENLRITEINARFVFNGFMHVVYAQQALEEIGICGGGNGLVGARDVESTLNGMLRLFRPEVPVHLLKGEEPGMDIHLVVDYAKRKLGFTPRFITPADLRLSHTEMSKDAVTLCCVVDEKDTSGPVFVNDAGEHFEEIRQVGFELHQRELLALSPEILRALSTRCFNDLRTILLVHDKRMLGIVKQELDCLTGRGILTRAQAETLDRGIADTVLPGSPELRELANRCAESPQLAAEYVSKPVRSGKGNGIVFGEDLTQGEWISRLEAMNNLSLATPVSDLCIIQRRIRPILYDVVLTESSKLAKCPLIGTYHSVGGEFLGFGVWRSSSDRVCAISHGGAWTCSVMRGD